MAEEKGKSRDAELADLALKFADQIAQRTNNVQEQITLAAKIESLITMRMVNVVFPEGVEK